MVVNAGEVVNWHPDVGKLQLRASTLLTDPKLREEFYKVIEVLKRSFADSTSPKKQKGTELLRYPDAERVIPDPLEMRIQYELIYCQQVFGLSCILRGYLARVYTKQKGP